MSNLSDLLPAGAGAKVATITADGTVPTGSAVVIQSDGTAKVISSSTSSETLASGLANDFTTDAPNRQIQIVHDSTNDKMVILHIDSSGNGKATVATTSGTSELTYGSATTWSTGLDDAYAIAFDSTNGKVVIAYKHSSNSNYGTAIVGTVSGTSISFGTPTVFQSSRAEHIGMTYDSYNGKIVIGFGDDGVSPGRTPKAVVGTVSGTSISFGSSVTIESTSGTEGVMGVAYDSTNYKVVFAYLLGNDKMRSVVGTVSGTSISFGTIVTIEEGQDTRGYNNNISAVYDSTNQRIAVFYIGEGTGGGGAVKGAVGTVSGTDITYGSDQTITNSQSKQQDAIYHAAAGKVLLGYCDDSSSGNNLIYHEITIASSGNSFTVDTTVSNYVTGNVNDIAFGYDSTGKLTVVCFRVFSSPNRGEARPLVTAYSETTTNLTATNFLGIANQAISGSASGEIVVPGGVITNSSILPLAYSLTAGSETVYEAAESYENSIAYDPDSGKVIIAYRDGGNSSYGTVIVGTVSGSSISFGSPVVFNEGSTSTPVIAYDTLNNKLAIAYTDGGNSNYGTGIVGTVSGDSVSFGSETVFNSGTTLDLAISHGGYSTEGKFVIGYRDNSNSNYGTAIVAFVSSGSLAYGTAAVFNSATTTAIAVASDNTTGKFLISYKDGGNSNYGTAVVATLSGGSISYGSETFFKASSGISYNAMTYHSGSDKFILAYNDVGNSGYASAIVATISGTGVSFGSELTIGSFNSAFFNIAYNSNQDRIVVGVCNLDSSNRGELYNLSLSGTTLSLEGSGVVFNTGDTSNIALVYDATAQSVVVAYRDSGNSNHGTAVVATHSGSSPSLTVGSTYYVQNDGTISTSSSSVTAGKAIGTSTLLLTG